MDARACNLGTHTDPYVVTYDVYTFWSYHDQFGTIHQIYATVDNNFGQCPNDSRPANATVTLADGSGYTIYVDSTPSATVYPSKGGSITPPLQNGVGAATATDKNGNQVSVNSAGAFTDTLGTTALTVAGVAPANTTFTYTAPSGANAAYTVSYQTYTVRTNFGCSGINEFNASGTTTYSLVDKVTLPDGSFYQFTYETTPGDTHSPHHVTGRLAAVTLPTGGTISYSYNNGNIVGSAASQGIVCADGSTAGLQRTTPDTGSNYWTYARSLVSGSHWQTKVTTPPDPQNQNSAGDDTVIDFQMETTNTNNFYETQRQLYQGPSSGTLIQTTTTCYNGYTSTCTTNPIATPIVQKLVTIQYGSLSCQHIYSYNLFGLLTEVDDYDYGNPGPGPLIRKTIISFANLGNHLNASKQTITVKDGVGTIKSQTTIAYDETGPTATSGTPQHIAVSGARGNPTTYTYLTGVSKTLAYYDTGMLKTFNDVNGAATTYNYSSVSASCGNTVPTSLSLPLNLTRSFIWNCTGGVQTQLTDENNQNTATAYTDSFFWRPGSITDPTNAVTNFYYPSSSPFTTSESKLSFNGTNSVVDLLTTVDGLGRVHLQQRKQGPSATNYDTIETDYDSLGRVSRLTLPYAGTVGQTSSSAPARTYVYDALNRLLQVTDGGTGTPGTTAYSYPQNDVFVTVGPAPTGEGTKRRQLEYDAISRLTSVCEITGGTTAYPAGTCAQSSPQTGYWTKYTYDVIGNLTGVTQNAQSTGNQQSRSYNYDGLNRLIVETNPEFGPGTLNYTFDSAAGCTGTSSGDLVKRVDPQGNTTCYTYDAYHRVTSATYSGPYATNTPSKYFVYDTATVNTTAMINAKMRLAEAYTCVSPCTSNITDLGFSYTVRGEVSDVCQSTPHSGGYYHVPASYWANGGLNQLNALPNSQPSLPGLPIMTYSVDGEGRINTVSASSGPSPVTGTAYNIASLPTAVTLGSLDSDSFSYDSNTLRMTQYQFNINAQAVAGTLTWNANNTLKQLVITDPFNSADTQTCSYAYDDLARLTSGNCGTGWSQTFTYDWFGNLNKDGSMPFMPFYSSTTNRM